MSLWLNKINERSSYSQLLIPTQEANSGIGVLNSGVIQNLISLNKFE